MMENKEEYSTRNVKQPEVQFHNGTMLAGAERLIYLHAANELPSKYIDEASEAINLQPLECR